MHPLDDLSPLEGGRDEFAGDAAALVVAGLGTGSPWWIDRALSWVEGGVWAVEVRDALATVSADSSVPQELRERAERMARPQGLASDRSVFTSYGATDRWGQDLFLHRGWRYAAVVSACLVVAAGWVLALGDAGGAAFFLLGAVALSLYGLHDYRHRNE